VYSVFGLYYYLRIANAMFMRQPLEAERLRVSPMMGLALALSAFITLWIGIFPDPLIRTVDRVLGLAPVSSVAQLWR
jgi:NADH:ubiquinone oxidoreductase subunit 2 (subunit N)